MDEKMLKKLASYSVLYAEDEAGVRKNVYELLGLLFKEVYLATDGEEAYKLFVEHKPDLIITDIKMPHLSGIDLAKKIRENDQKADIIIITAYTEVDFMLEAIELSLLRYIVKPITEPKLFDALEKFLQAKEKAHLQELAPNWYYDSLQKTITHESDIYELTKKEARFIELLLQKDSIISYEEIEQKLWESEYMSLNALRLMIKNLRKKLPEGTLKNIQGIGYKL
ncbi:MULTISPECIES: response regulator [unclassified Sulfurospirillum]|uniref:response regulator transcription factor n=1 Tax=unclassified Sulfurospirillum TaxID=2618290 RepID=UPI000B183BAD|nr:MULTISPECIES: response regulator [unclassified Sulfurospirillum]